MGMAPLKDRAIEFLDGRVRKYTAADTIKFEVAKTVSARKIAERTSLFSVPRILAVDEIAGWIDFERFDNIKPLWKVIAYDEQWHQWIERAGQALGAIHETMRLDESLTVAFPHEWMLVQEESVYVHGDYTATNLQVDTSNNSLVVIDWATAPALNGVYTYGPRYYDVVWFLIGLFHRGLPYNSFGRWWPNPRADSFLKGYMQFCGQQLDMPAFCRCKQLATNVQKRRQSEHLDASHIIDRVLYHFGALRWKLYRPSP